MVGFSSEFGVIESAGWVQKIHNFSPIAIPKNGYIYVYCSNESQYPVFFDNLQLVHDRGPILEETHYYPFGLTMAGISSEAAKGITYPTNKKKYNGIEETTELGLNQYDAQLRILDPQIGIWWQVDPETENMEMWSPYASNYDNPILYKDPLGNEPECCWGELKDAIVQSVKQVSSLVAGAVNAWGSDQALGAGSKTASQAGITGDNASFYSAGQTVGHVVALVTGAAEVIGGGGGELASVGLATPIAIPVAAHGVSVFATAGYKLFSSAPTQETPPAGGTRSKNRLPDKGEPNSTQTNKPGTTTKKYGPDGNVQKEFNKGHPGNNVPKKEKSNHIHDYKPNPQNPTGRGDRQPGRPPKKNELKKDFNQ